MGPIRAVKTCFLKYFDFSSRASRSEFWWWTLFVVVGGVVTAILDIMIFGIEESGVDFFAEIGIVNGIFNVATIVPSVAVTVRRLHDTNWTGWWVLAQLIVTIASFAITFVTLGGDSDEFSVLLMVCWAVWTILSLTIFFRMFTAGNEGTNRFGPNPLATAANRGTGHRHGA